MSGTGLYQKVISDQESGHYSIFRISDGYAALKELFPNGDANELNFVLFSTSGVHGTYATLEDIEESLTKYGDRNSWEGEIPPYDWHPTIVTILIVQPRLVTLRYTGRCEVTLENLPYLKKLRQSSWDVMQKIGRAE